MFDKVVYTYKEEGEGSPMYKHAIIPRREWWEKKIFGPWSRLLYDKNTTGPTSRFFPEAQVSRMDFKPVQPGSSDDPFDSKNGLISQVRWRQRLPLVIKMIITDHHDNYCQSSKRSLSIIKMIIINHQKDPHRSSKRSSPGERLPHWSLLPDQLRLGQLLDIHHWGSMFMLSSRLWPILTTRKPGAWVTM